MRFIKMTFLITTVLPGLSSYISGWAFFSVVRGELHHSYSLISVRGQVPIKRTARFNAVNSFNLFKTMKSGGDLITCSLSGRH